MIPVSSSNHKQGCSPVSSNCVIWQGPDLPIIGLCNGDTISDVIAKLAAELTDISESTSIAGVDLTCLSLSSSPANQEELFQAIVDELCSLDGRCDTLEGGSGGSGSGNTEITASLPLCLQYTNNENDLVTVLPIDQYAELVAAKVCELVSDIETLETQIVDHESRITTLESNTVSEYTTPQITPNCVLPAVPTNIDVVVDELEEQFCILKSALGESTDLLAVTTYQCNILSSDGQLGGSGTMSSLEGWNTQVSNVAESLQNMWLTICDMRAAIKDIQTNCCTIDCNSIVFAAFGTYSEGTITLNFNGTVIPNDFTECNPAGNTVTITDAAANTYTTTVSVTDALAGDDTETIDISGSALSELSNYTVTITLCTTEGSVTCEKTLSFEVVNDASSCGIPSAVTASIT